MNASTEPTKPPVGTSADGRETGREPIFNLAPAVVLLGGICIGVHALRGLFLDPATDAGLIARFAFIPLRYSGPYGLDIYALLGPFTYAFLHGSLAHLLVNMIWLAAFGSPLANRIGSLRFIAFWFAGAIAAVALHFALYPGSFTPLVGASGAISAMMGGAARFAFRVDRRLRKPAFTGPVLPLSLVFRSRTVLVFLAVWMVVNLATGLAADTVAGASRIAWEAHIGGFLLGFFGVRLFDRRQRPDFPSQEGRGENGPHGRDLH